MLYDDMYSVSFNFVILLLNGVMLGTCYVLKHRIALFMHFLCKTVFTAKYFL